MHTKTLRNRNSEKLQESHQNDLNQIYGFNKVPPLGLNTRGGGRGGGDGCRSSLTLRCKNIRFCTFNVQKMLRDHSSFSSHNNSRVSLSRERDRSRGRSAHLDVSHSPVIDES